MAPIVHGLEAEYYGRINFVFLDADDLATVGFQKVLGFRAQPEFYLLDGDGNKLYHWFGYVDDTSFREQFDLALGR